MRLREVDVGGAPLALREWGAVSGIPLLFWHSLGVGGNGAFLGVVADPLVEAGVRPIAIDAPGYGRSPARPRDAYEIESLAALLWQVADAIELERPILAGHSWGGVLAVTAAEQRPDDVRALVLLDSGHVDYADWPGADPTATYESLLEQVRGDSWASWSELEAELVAAGIAGEQTLPAWREAVDDGPSGFAVRATPEARAAAMHGLIRARASNAWPTLASARIPTLLVLATEPKEEGDANAQAAARFSAAVPHADVRPIAGMRHNVFADLGALAGDLIAEWLAAEDLL